MPQVIYNPIMAMGFLGNVYLLALDNCLFVSRVGMGAEGALFCLKNQIRICRVPQGTAEHDLCARA
jgi:hypothetical protein